MQRVSTSLRHHKADIALLVASIGSVITIMLTVFGIAGGYSPINPFWIGSVTCAVIGLFLCWLWRPDQGATVEAIDGTWGTWGICVAFAIIFRDWREAISFAIVLSVALATTIWLKRRTR
jgi:hypothetical protein